MIFGNYQSRVHIQTHTQFVINPSIGFTWNMTYFRFAIAFAWLNIQARIGFGRKRKEG